MSNYIQHTNSFLSTQKISGQTIISEYSVVNNMEFINHVKRMNIPKDHSFISFNVKSLFTYVPLDFIIDVILRRIYYEKEVYTIIKRSEMKELYFYSQGMYILRSIMTYINSAMVVQWDLHWDQ